MLFYSEKKGKCTTKKRFNYLFLLFLVQNSDEIVEGDNFEKGIALLSRDEVRSIVVLGKFGNSVTSTSLCISKKFFKRS